MTIFDTTLSQADGSAAPLSRYRGYKTILFYEDRHSTEINQRFKERLRGYPGPVIAVANLEAWNFFPARDLALAGVRSQEKKFATTILIDFAGVLSRPPHALPKDTSTVLVLGPEGDVLWRKSGPISANEIEDALGLTA